MIYLLIASLRYRFTHPELTETQLLMNIWEVITWQ